MLDMAILLLVPLTFCLADWESCVTPPLRPSQDEYSISSVYTADPVVGDVGLEISNRTNNS